MCVAFYYINLQMEYTKEMLSITGRYLVVFAPLGIVAFFLRGYPIAVLAITAVYCHVSLYYVVDNVIYVSMIRNIKNRINFK